MEPDPDDDCGTLNGKRCTWVGSGLDFTFPENKGTAELLAAMVQKALAASTPGREKAIKKGWETWAPMRQGDAAYLDQDTQAAVKEYSYQWYRALNGALRNGRVSQAVDKRVRSIIRGVHAVPKESNVTLFRGARAWKVFQTGEEFTERGFFSATSHFHMAVSYTDAVKQGNSNDERLSAVFVLRYTKPSQRIYLDAQLSHYEQEYESFALPGEKWRVVEVGTLVYASHSIQMVTIEYLGSDADSFPWVVDPSIDRIAQEELVVLSQPDFGDATWLCTSTDDGGLTGEWKICRTPSGMGLRREHLMSGHDQEIECLLYRGWTLVRRLSYSKLGALIDVKKSLRYGYTDRDGNMGVCREVKVTTHYVMMMLQESVDWVSIDGADRSDDLAALFVAGHVRSPARFEDPASPAHPSTAALQPPVVTPSRRVTRVGLYVVVNGTELLVHRRADFLHHYICTPGGSVDPGEHPMGAVLREACEESGVMPHGAVYSFFLSDDKTFAGYVCHLTTRPRVAGPDDRHHDEIDMEYDFAGVPGAHVVPGTGHAFVRLQGLHDWIKANMDCTHNSLFLQCLKLLEGASSGAVSFTQGHLKRRPHASPRATVM